MRELFRACLSLRLLVIVASAALWQRDPPRLLLQIRDELWSSERNDWRVDSSVVTVGLRRYPGDAL